MSKLFNNDRCKSFICKVLSGHKKQRLRSTLLDTRYFDKRLWKLTCHLISKDKFNREIAEKLVRRKHPIFSQKVLMRKKLEVLTDLSADKSELNFQVLEIFEYGELYRYEPVGEVLRLLRSNEPEITDLSVRTLDNLIEHEISTKYREWKRIQLQEEEGFSRRSYIESIPQEEWESEEIRLAEMDRKEACRIKRVP
jgi:hypothetical protein